MIDFILNTSFVTNLVVVDTTNNHFSIFQEIAFKENWLIHETKTLPDTQNFLVQNAFNIIIAWHNEKGLATFLETENEKIPFIVLILYEEEKTLNQSGLINYSSRKIDVLKIPLSAELIYLKITLLQKSYFNKEDIPLDYFIENTPLVFLRISYDGIITYCNYVTQQLFEYSRHELIGQPFSILLPNKTQSKRWYTYFQSMQMHETKKFTGITKSGQLLHLEINSYYNQNFRSKNTPLLISLHNISDLVQKNNEYENYFNIIEKAFLITIFNRNGKITYVNNNQKYTAQCTTQEMVGKSINDFYHDSSILIDIYKTIINDNIWDKEICNTKKNGEKYWTYDFISPFNSINGKIEQFALIRVDITAIKTDSTITKNRIIAEKSLKLKNDFLSNISHEIRTPLNSVLGFTDVLLETTITEKQKKYLEIIKKSGNLLLSSINDLLDLTRIEEGKLNLKFNPFSLESILKGTVAILSFEAELNDNKIIEDYCDVENLVLIGDENRLQQVLINILKNAIKFTKGGVIKIKVRKIAEQNEKVKYVFEITDTGIGIKKEKLNQIFDAFMQGEEYLTREHQGLGIGLTIVKKLIQAFNGKIEIESNENKGTSVKIFISFSKDPNQQKRELVTKNKTNNIKVLLVEDNINNQILATVKLESYGYIVDIANNGLEVLEKHQQNDYDIILMDLQLPFLDGYSATKEIRANFPIEKSKIPIIALTAHTSNGNLEKMQIIGMNDYVYKPFKSKELHEKIINAIKNKDKPKTENVTFKTEEELFFCEVDFDYIKEECLGNEKIFKLYLHTFIKEFEDFLDKSSFYANNNDIENIYKCSHKILPTVKTLSLKEIQEILISIHDNSKNNLEMKYDHAIAEIVNYYATVKKQINEKLI